MGGKHRAVPVAQQHGVGDGVEQRLDFAVAGGELGGAPGDALFELGMRGFDSNADGLIMACLNTRSHTVIDCLEQKLAAPVITSTQAILWHALRLAGIDDRIRGYGRLFDG